MTRVFQSTCTGTLSIDDSHHLRKVLRLKKGSQFEIVFTNSKQAFLAEITNSSGAIEYSTLAELKQEYCLPEINLIFSVCKGARNDLVAEKCTELGVNQIIFYQAEHSIAKMSEHKLERLNKIAYSAACQSSRLSLAELVYAPTRTELLALIGKPARKLIGSLQEPRTTITEACQNSETFYLAIGPEGDFSKSEYNFFKEQDFQAVTLGPGVLRSETAAIALTAGVRMIAAA